MTFTKNTKVRVIEQSGAEWTGVIRSYHGNNTYIVRPDDAAFADAHNASVYERHSGVFFVSTRFANINEI